MSVFFRPIGSNNVFNFFEDKDKSGRVKTISYNLDTDGSIKGSGKGWHPEAVDGCKNG